jgi:hypothetical protein
VDRYDKRSEEAHVALKERISKFMKEGTKISYKFKKSLIEVEKRKKQKDDYYSQRSDVVRREATAQLQSTLQKSIEMRKGKPPINEDADFFYIEDSAIRVKTDCCK